MRRMGETQHKGVFMYFDKPGKENTANTLALALDRAKQLGLEEVVVASTKGETARQAIALFQGFKVVVITFLLLLFGEIIPKILGEALPEPIASFLSPALAVVRRVMRPVVLLVQGLIFWARPRQRVTPGRRCTTTPTGSSMERLSVVVKLWSSRIRPHGRG